MQVRKTRGHYHMRLSLFLLFHTTIKTRRIMLLLLLIDNAVADPENKAGGFTTTVRKSLHVTSIRKRVREGDVPPPARSAEAQRCSTICGRYLIEKSARQSTFNLA